VPAAPFTVGPRVETTDGVEIATYELGGSGPPLILAHATGFHGRVWLPVAAALRSRYHCWSFDSRGHGDSGKAPDGNYDWAGFARDVQAVIEGVSIVEALVFDGGTEPPWAVGHSCGGAAVLLAEEAKPGTFAGLYCYEPVVPIPDGASVDQPSDNPLAAGARRRREVFDSREAALENYAAKRPFTDFDPAALEAYVAWGFHDLANGTVELSCRREDEARVYEQAWHHDAFQNLGEVRCPVILASGGRQAHFGREAIDAMAGRLTVPRAVEVHEDLGHFGPMEQPAAVAAAIIAAFDGLAPSPRGSVASL